jgi:hypothetical protein
MKTVKVGWRKSDWIKKVADSWLFAAPVASLALFNDYKTFSFYLLISVIAAKFVSNFFEIIHNHEPARRNKRAVGSGRKTITRPKGARESDQKL